MRAASLELRQRILASCDRHEGTHAEIAHQFHVSLAFVKKLLHKRRVTGDIAPRHCFSGRKPHILAEHAEHLRALLEKDARCTLKELRDALGLTCTLSALHYVLAKLGLDRRRRLSR